MYVPHWFTSNRNVLLSVEYQFIELWINSGGFVLSRGGALEARWVEIDDELWTERTGLGTRQRFNAIKGLLAHAVLEVQGDKFIVEMNSLRALFAARSKVAEKVVHNPKAREARAGQQIHKSCVSGGCARLGGLFAVDQVDNLDELERFYDAKVSQFYRGFGNILHSSRAEVVLDSTKQAFTMFVPSVSADKPGGSVGGVVGLTGAAAGSGPSCSPTTTALTASQDSENGNILHSSRAEVALESTKVKPRRRVFSTVSPPSPTSPPPKMALLSSTFEQWPKTVAALESTGFAFGPEFVRSLLIAVKVCGAFDDLQLSIAVVDAYRSKRKTQTGVGLFLNTVPEYLRLVLRSVASAGSDGRTSGNNAAARLARTLRASAQRLAGRSGAGDLIDELVRAAAVGVDFDALNDLESKIVGSAGQLLTSAEAASIDDQVNASVMAAKKRGCSGALLNAEETNRRWPLTLKVLIGVSSLGAAE